MTPPKKQSTSLNKLLAEAVRSGDSERTRTLIGIGADVSSCPRTLPVFCYAEKESVMKVLLEAGADIHVRYHGRTLLHSAALSDFGKVDILLRLGADPNIRDDLDETPIFAAQQAGRADIVAILATNGADVNVQNNEGWTPLHGAVIGGAIAVAEVLLRNGASTEVQDNDGATPLFVVALMNNVWEDDFIGLLARYHADVNAVRPSDQFRPIHYAAFHGNNELVGRLAKMGANLIAKSVAGSSALDIAIARGHDSTARVLRELTSE